MRRRQCIATLSAAAAILALHPRSQAQSGGSPTLVLIELAGGNDGLNTFIPYTDPQYRRLRPRLGISGGIPVSSTIALHPALAEWQPLLEQGQMAVVQNVGYPNPDLSHFRSKEIWQSASLGSPDSGWLARYLQVTQGASTDGVALGDEYPLALLGDDSTYLHLAPNLAVQAEGRLGQAMQAVYAATHLDPLAEQVRQTVVESTQAVDDLAQDVERRLINQGYPQGSLGRQLVVAGRLIESGAKVIYLTLGGWDTHVNQAGIHQRLLGQLGPGLAAFHRDLVANGLDQQVVVMVQSEFGRRPAENGSGGTDHGTAGPVILMGKSVQGGWYGGDPALDSLMDGNLPIQVDFRSVYREVLAQGLGVDPVAILGEDFPSLGILR